MDQGLVNAIARYRQATQPVSDESRVAEGGPFLPATGITKRRSGSYCGTVAHKKYGSMGTLAQYMKWLGVTFQ